MWIKAPGRIRILGHPSASVLGLSLDFAVDRYFEIAASPSPGQNSLLDIDTGKILEVEWNPASDFSLPPNSDTQWASALIKVIAAFRKRNLPIPTIQLAFTGTLPSSSGLGASAARSVAMALALDRLAGTRLSAFAMADICGLPDMLPILLAKHECALKLDCRTGEHHCIPLRINPYRFLLAYLPAPSATDAIPHAGPDESASRDLENAWQKIRSLEPDLHALEELGEKDLERFQPELTPGEYARIMQVAEENRHILEAEKCLLAGDVDRFGRLLNESRPSGKPNWRRPSRESQSLMELAAANEGTLGGTYIVDGSEAAILFLVHRDAVAAFTDSIIRGFRRGYGRAASVIECNPSDGASISEGLGDAESHPGWSQGGSRNSPSSMGSRAFS